MHNARNQNPFGVQAVEHYASSMFETTEAMADIVARAAQAGIVSDCLETRFKLIEVLGRLRLSPTAKRECDDSSQAGFGAPRKAKIAHGSARGRGQFESLSDACEHVAGRNSA